MASSIAYYDVNPGSYKQYLKEKRLDERNCGQDLRPDHGLSKLINKAWWKDSNAKKAMSKNHMFISSSNCIGITMPYG